MQLRPQRSHISIVLMAANAPGKCINTKSINDDTSELNERKATWIFEPIIIYLLNDLCKITIIKRSWTARHRQWRTGLDSVFAVRNGEKKNDATRFRRWAGHVHCRATIVAPPLYTRSAERLIRISECELCECVFIQSIKMCARVRGAGIPGYLSAFCIRGSDYVVNDAY